MSEPMIFTSKRSFIDQYVRPVLGDYADEFDLDAIADEMLELYSPPRGMDPAWRNSNLTGFIERQDVDFMEIMRRNDKTLAPAATGSEGYSSLESDATDTAYPIEGEHIRDAEQLLEELDTDHVRQQLDL